MTPIFVILLLTVPRIAFAQQSEVEFSWNFINFTWPSEEIYEEAVTTGKYNPENVVISGMQYCDGQLFFCMPRIREGCPATLGVIDIAASTSNNISSPLISPYPDWETTLQEKDPDSCKNRLESVSGIQVDPDGHRLWVLDGTNIYNNTICPPKLVVLNLKDNGTIDWTYEFPPEICANPGCMMSKIKLDKSNGSTFAYISTCSPDSPGLIVFSEKEMRAWKFTDCTMFADLKEKDFMVHDVYMWDRTNINGIALSNELENGHKELFYCSGSGSDLFVISTEILKSEWETASSEWRWDVEHVGRMSGPSGDIEMDNEGNMYLADVTRSSIGVWDVSTPMSTTSTVVEDPENIFWGDSFCFDDEGNLRMLSNEIHKIKNLDFQLTLSDDTHCTVYKIPTGTSSYMDD